MFSRGEILESALLSKAAYTTIDKAAAFHDSETGCDCYVLHGERIAFVVFRGTSSFQDALQDCNVEVVPFSTIADEAALVHAGFLCQANSALPFIRNELAGFSGEIRVTGHSLGAGCSQLIACRLALEYAGNAEVPVSYIGFGTPRVGDKQWKALFEAHVTRAVRVKNSADPVCGVATRVPYTHAGEEHHVGRADPHPELPLMSNIADHDVSSGYIANITKDHPNAREESAVHYVLMFMAGKLAGVARGFKH